MNADPAVMEHFTTMLSREESDAMADRLAGDVLRDGYGLWAVELPGEADMIGFVGVLDADAQMPFAPAVEIGWRLARPYWGRGLAYEAAAASMAFAFDELAAQEVVACTAVGNLRSRRLMERLGMTYDPGGNFDHPAIDPQHPLRAHVLYRIAAPGGG